MVAVKWITFPPTSLILLSDRNFRVLNKKTFHRFIPKDFILIHKSIHKKCKCEGKFKQTIIISIRERPLQEERYHLSVLLRWDILLISSFSSKLFHTASFFSISDILIWYGNNTNTIHSALKNHIYLYMEFYVFSLFVLVLSFYQVCLLKSVLES